MTLKFYYKQVILDKLTSYIGLKNTNAHYAPNKEIEDGYNGHNANKSKWCGICTMYVQMHLEWSYMEKIYEIQTNSPDVLTKNGKKKVLSEREIP